MSNLSRLLFLFARVGLEAHHLRHTVLADFGEAVTQFGQRRGILPAPAPSPLPKT